nr:polyprotein, putative [Tanacetum cinerariifolium]
MDPNILPHFDYYYSRISLTKVRSALLKMRKNKAVGSYQLPVEAYISLGVKGGLLASSIRSSQAQRCLKNGDSVTSTLSLRTKAMQCWLITKTLANRMKVAKLRMLSWASGKTMLDMIHSEVYKAKLEMETIINKMREGRLRWFGHVRRIAQSAPLRRVEALVVDGLRRRVKLIGPSPLETKPMAVQDMLAEESCSTWLDYVGPLITDELDSEKCWSYRDPNGNVQGSFSLAQLRMWKDYFPSDLKIWSYSSNVKETILLHSVLKRRTKDAG